MRFLQLLAMVSITSCVWAESSNIHLGVASCASSGCHGRLIAADEGIRGNEFATWVKQDSHARAYKTLLSAESKAIAQRLGMAAAHTANVCLDCHSTNVPAAFRGPKFQISDGVGCEACHGPSVEWIDSHSSDATHANNIAGGMYPLEDPLKRAELCLSCHMGDDNNYVTHQMFSAGHPRLAFELETFSANQPPHYDADEDYATRKVALTAFSLWLTGQVAATRSYIDLVSRRIPARDIFPDLALYDCHSCHQALDSNRWNPLNQTRGTQSLPGLQEQHFLILMAVAEVVQPQSVTRLRKLTNDLVTAGQQNAESVLAATKPLTEWLDSNAVGWLEKPFNLNQVRAIRRAMVGAAAKGRFFNYIAAEQMVMGVQSLSFHVGDADKLAAPIDQLFDSLQTNANYSPQRFRSVSVSVLDAF